MHLTRHIGFGERRRADRDAQRRGHPAAPGGAPPRHRVDGPQDAALATCPCGFAWPAAVTTSVACPHCGTGQAW